MTARIGAAAVLALVLVSAVGAAPQKKPAANAAANNGGLSTKDFRIETNETQYNYGSGRFTMPHRVKFFRPGTDVTGDSAQGNSQTGQVTITGHVVLHDNGNSAEARDAGAPAGNGPSTLQCDQLEIDSKRKVYVATGNVHFVQGTRTATADTGRLDQGGHSLDLQGNVHLTDGGSTFSGNTVHYDTLTKDVNTTGNPSVMTQPAGAAGFGAPKSSLPTAPPKKK
jgi:lipopolysaccharide assembly outer membrane protein LptD (OstA)